MPKQVSNLLTVAEVKSRSVGRHADGGGLYLLVKESGARSWVFRFMLNGRSRDIGLGPASGNDMIRLAAARDKAMELRKQVKAGIDPLVDRQQRAAKALAEVHAAKVAAVTFRAVAEAHIAGNEAGWRNSKHRQQWRNTLETYVYPVIGDLPVSDIKTPHVLQILEPIWALKPETASRVRGRIETILDAAKARGYRSGENPATWRGHLAQLLPPRKRLGRGHHKALAYDDVPVFVRNLRTRQATAALALEFTILTATRTGEVLGATWEEVDIQRAVWTIPGHRMKGGVEHRVPLSARALEILEIVRPLNTDHLFPGARGGRLSGMAMTMLLRRMKTDSTVHGFRSAFRDWCAERTSYAHEVAEMALAHAIGNKAEAAYRRGNLFEKRARLMADWAQFCSSPGQQGANVSPIKSIR